MVAPGDFVVFDPDSADIVGGDFGIDPTGTVITINRPGLYQVDWNINLAPDSTPAVVGTLENSAPASGSASSTGGNFSSGTLIEVDSVPFTISLYNYGELIALDDSDAFVNSAASIRIHRFADGPRA